MVVVCIYLCHFKFSKTEYINICSYVPNFVVKFTNTCYFLMIVLSQISQMVSPNQGSASINLDLPAFWTSLQSLVLVIAAQ